MRLFPRRLVSSAVQRRHQQRRTRVAAASCILLSASLTAFAVPGSHSLFLAFLLGSAAAFHALWLLLSRRDDAPGRHDQALTLLAMANLVWMGYAT